MRSVASRPSTWGMRMSIKHDVGRVLADRALGLLAVGGLADDGDVLGGGEHHRQRGAHERVVVDDQDADQRCPRQPCPEPVLVRAA